MRRLDNSSFGLLIAYVIPGLIVLWGVSHWSSTVQGWFVTDPEISPTVAGFLFLTVGSVTSGMIVSTVRWMIVDRIHNWTGIRRGRWDYGTLRDRVAAYEVIVSNQYRYYQHYSNSFVAILFAFLVHVSRAGLPAMDIVAALCVVEATMWFGSRDTLANYYDRAERLLGSTPHPETRRSDAMDLESEDNSSRLMAPPRDWYTHGRISTFLKESCPEEELTRN